VTAEVRSVEQQDGRPVVVGVTRFAGEVIDQLCQPGTAARNSPTGFLFYVPIDVRDRSDDDGARGSGRTRGAMFDRGAQRGW
jgi:hypothetical protein